MKSTQITYIINNLLQGGNTQHINSNISLNSNSNNLKIKMNTTLHTFNGRPDSNTDQWLYVSNRILAIINYSDEEKVAIATNYLRELA